MSDKQVNGKVGQKIKKRNRREQQQQSVIPMIDNTKILQMRMYLTSQLMNHLLEMVEKRTEYANQIITNESYFAFARQMASNAIHFTDEE